MFEPFVQYLSKAATQTRVSFLEEVLDPVFVVEPYAKGGDETVQTLGADTKAGGAGTLVQRSVTPIRKSPGVNQFSLMVTIGRAATNDLRIVAEDVSKFHAYVMLTKAGEKKLADASSTFGTFYNDRQLLKGERVPLSSGDRVRLGHGVELLYFEPADFYVYLREEA